MIVAVSQWPEAAIAMTGILFAATVVSVAIWQILGTARAGLSAKRERAYRQVAEDAVEAERRTSEQLERAVAELAELRRQTSELERLLKAVE